MMSDTSTLMPDLTAPRHVYVVDDDLFVLEAICARLEQEGFVTKAYSDPETFLAEASGLAKGCIVLDLQMPGMGGLQVQRELLQIGIAFPIIFHTGKGKVQDVVAGMRTGATDFVQKGRGLDALVRSLEGVFGA